MLTRIDHVMICVPNTGEQAMLVGPEHACGAYIAFVGPARGRAGPMK
ncbi:MAG TPA: hypothetical protein VGV13_14095 [Methylomirabilota bacterium]|nr:hypothetical protein [Methylomirabilota bacterium]